LIGLFSSHRLSFFISVTEYFDRESLFVFVCLFVGLLVGSFVRRGGRCDLSKNKSPIFMKFGTDAKHSINF